MTITNSTDWPLWFLRRMTSWCCKQLDMPGRDIKTAVFRNSRAAWGGCARYWRGAITVCVGHAGHFPTEGYRHANGHQNKIGDRVECLVWVTAHEAAHVAQKHTRTRQQGGGGGSEMATEWFAAPVLAKFRESKESLLAEWSAPPVAALRAPCKSLPERRAAKAQSDLARWTRRLKIAQTKVKKLRARVHYYERQAINQIES